MEPLWYARERRLTYCVVVHDFWINMTGYVRGIKVKTNGGILFGQDKKRLLEMRTEHGKVVFNHVRDIHEDFVES